MKLARPIQPPVQKEHSELTQVITSGFNYYIHCVCMMTNIISILASLLSLIVFSIQLELSSHVSTSNWSYLIMFPLITRVILSCFHFQLELSYHVSTSNWSYLIEFPLITRVILSCFHFQLELSNHVSTSNSSYLIIFPLLTRVILSCFHL